MSPDIRNAALAFCIAVLFATPAAIAADRAGYLVSCEKDRGGADKAKCACMADKVDAAFKDKQRAFAYETLAKPIGELVNVESGLTEKEEDDITDQTFAFMKACGLVK